MRSAKRKFSILAVATAMSLPLSAYAGGPYSFTMSMWTFGQAQEEGTASNPSFYYDGADDWFWDYSINMTELGDPVDESFATGGGDGNTWNGAWGTTVLGTDISNPGVLTTSISPTTSDWIDVLSAPTASGLLFCGTAGGGGTFIPDEATSVNISAEDDGMTTSSGSSYYVYTTTTGADTPVFCSLWSIVGLEAGSHSNDLNLDVENVAYATLKYNESVTVWNWFGSDPSDYFDTSNWSQGVAPNGVDAVAMLGYQDAARSTPQPATTVTLSQNLTLGNLLFDNPNTYTVNGPGVLTMQASSGNDAEVFVNQGSHVVNATINLASNTDFYIAPGAQISLTAGLNVPYGEAVSVNGGGTISADNADVNGGTLSINAGAVGIEGNLSFGGGVVNIVGNTDGTGTSLNCSIGEVLWTGGTINQYGGTNSPSSGISMGLGGASTYNMYNGILSCGAINISYYGYGDTTSTFAQSGGSVTAAGLYLGCGGGNSCNSVYDLSGGALNCTTEAIGGDGPGTFIHSGGTNTVSGDLSVGGSAFGVEYTGAYTITGGALTVDGVLTVNPSGTFEYGGGSIAANVDNYGTFNVRGGSETLDGDFTNESGATLKTYGTTFTVTGTFTNNGTYSSDPATNRFGTLEVGASGNLLGSIGDRFVVSGNLLSDSRASRAWNTVGAALFFAGGNGPHIFDVTGVDLGPTEAGLDDNFAWGAVSLAPGDLLELEASGVGSAGLYIGTLYLEDGLSQLSDISAEDVNVYYAAALNPWFGGQTYLLSGGGELIPIALTGTPFSLLQSAQLISLPEPASLSLLGIGAVGLLSRRGQRKSPETENRVV